MNPPVSAVANPPAWRTRPSRREAWLCVLGALYVPTVFGFFTSCGHCRLIWVWAWLITPGALPAWFLGQALHLRNTLWLMLVIAILITVAVQIGLVRARRLGWRWFLVILAASAVLHFFAALAAFCAIRA